MRQVTTPSTAASRYSSVSSSDDMRRSYQCRIWRPMQQSVRQVMVQVRVLERLDKMSR